MNEAQIREAVLAALVQVAPETDPTALAGDVSLTEQLDLDSLDHLNFIVGINERTGVEIPERDYPKLATIDGCVAYVQAATAGVHA